MDGRSVGLGEDVAASVSEPPRVLRRFNPVAQLPTTIVHGAYGPSSDSGPEATFGAYGPSSDSGPEATFSASYPRSRKHAALRAVAALWPPRPLSPPK